MKNILRKYIREAFSKEKSRLYGKIYFTFGDLGFYYDTESVRIEDKELEEKLEKLPIYKQFNSYNDWKDNIISSITNLNFSKTNSANDKSKEYLFNHYLEKGPLIIKKIS